MGIEKTIIRLNKKGGDMNKNKTFKTVVKNGKRFNLLTLPESNFFKFEIINRYGANIERVIKDKTGKNLYGISHFIEHLGFKSTKDFTTEEILSIFHNEGVGNASTNHDRINYWFKTTMDNQNLAIQFVCNVAFNDLTKVSENEFATERQVVFNEAKRALDNHQLLFSRDSVSSLVGYESEDNVIGKPETIETFTLDDAIAIKNIFLTADQIDFNIIYDSTLVSEDNIIDKILNQLDYFQTPKKGYISVTHKEYLEYLKIPKISQIKIDSKSNQALTNITFDAIENTLVSGATLAYLSSLAKGTSLYDLIRDKNGLTYGIRFFTSIIAYKPYATFVCDVTKGNEKKLFELLKESINLSADEFSEDKYETYMKTAKLKRVMSNLNLESHEVWFYYNYMQASDLDLVRDTLALNVEDGYNYVEKEIITYTKMKESMEKIKYLVNNGMFSKVYT